MIKAQFQRVVVYVLTNSCSMDTSSVRIQVCFQIVKNQNSLGPVKGFGGHQKKTVNGVDGSEKHLELH